MTLNLEPQTCSSTSTTPTHVTGATNTKIRINLADLPSIWSLLTPELQEQFVKDSPISEAVINPLTWARKWTKTKDEQDPNNPYKHLPNYEYFDALHACAEKYAVLFVEKSRTMRGRETGKADLNSGIECSHSVQA
jgi:hypothetical protein